MTTITPDVSVLIPCYNCELTLLRAVNSVIDQPVNVEIILIDDCSTDNTRAIIANIVAQDARVKAVYRTQNGRIAASLNSGAAIATGRYLMRVDSDDWLEDGALKLLCDALDNAPPHVGFAYGGRVYYGRRSDPYIPTPFNRDAFDLHNASGYAYLFRRSIWTDGLQWEALGTFNGAVIDLEDWQHVHKMLAAGYDGLALQTVVLHYTFRWGGTWQELQNNSAAALDVLKAKFPTIKATAL